MKYFKPRIFKCAACRTTDLVPLFVSELPDTVWFIMIHPNTHHFHEFCEAHDVFVPKHRFIGYWEDRAVALWNLNNVNMREYSERYAV